MQNESSIGDHDNKSVETKDNAEDTVGNGEGENLESKPEDTQNDHVNTEEDEDPNVNDEKEDSIEPTSWKLLDVKAMKVNELRTELDARNMNSKGLKAQLVSRLQETLEKEEMEEMNKDIEEKKETVEAENKEIEEKVEPELASEATKAKETPGSVEDSKTEDPEVMEVDRKVNPSEKTSANDDDIFVKPPPMDEKQKLALTAAYKLPGKNNCSMLVIVRQIGDIHYWLLSKNLPIKHLLHNLFQRLPAF